MVLDAAHAVPEVLRARLDLFDHARTCTAAPGSCSLDCQRMRAVLAHASTCQHANSAVEGAGCSICRRLQCLVSAHARYLPQQPAPPSQEQQRPPKEQRPPPTVRQPKPKLQGVRVPMPPAGPKPTLVQLSTAPRSGAHHHDAHSQLSLETDRMIARAAALVAARLRRQQQLRPGGTAAHPPSANLSTLATDAPTEGSAASPKIFRQKRSTGDRAHTPQQLQTGRRKRVRFTADCVPRIEQLTPPSPSIGDAFEQIAAHTAFEQIAAHAHMSVQHAIAPPAGVATSAAPQPPHEEPEVEVTRDPELEAAAAAVAALMGHSKWL